MSEAPLTTLFRAARVAVIGDVMIDHHVFGRVSRVSEEAPVPVLLVDSERRALGGAANVAANIAALGGRAVLIGMVGDDAGGAALVDMVDQFRPAGGGGVEGRLAHARGRPTVTKTRYLGGRQQIVRVDRETAAPASADVEAELIAELEDAVPGCDLVVASDYGKGVLTDRVLAALFAACARAGKPCIVDPKRSRFADYRGAALITPNRKELAGAVHLPTETDAEAEAAARAAIAESGAAILLTRSEKGMSLYRDGQAPLHLPAEAREVFDVSGAGDTVVAGIALALACGLSHEQAMRVANAAAGIVVAKVGTAIVTQAELSAAPKAQSHEEQAHESALAPLERARALRDRWRAEGLIVGFTNGCFDLLHAGHVSLIGQAAGACDRLIVALNSDASVRRLKGETRPVQSLENRAAIMASLKGVDLVLGFEEDTPLALIEALEPDVLVKGADYAESEVVGGDLVKARGGRIVRAELTEGQSTSALVKKARDRT
ncbi:MAG: D-glycero-beta-D-manno-heptose-7-phosphate kinase [Hyphomonadaceae bacterium]